MYKGVGRIRTQASVTSSRSLRICRSVGWSRITAYKGAAGSETTVMDVVYCYNSAGSALNCGTAAATDGSKVPSTYNALTQ